MNAMTAALLEEDEKLTKLGMVKTELSPAKYATAVQALSDGIWKTVEASKASGERGKAFHKFIQSKDLAGIAPK